MCWCYELCAVDLYVLILWIISCHLQEPFWFINMIASLTSCLHKLYFPGVTSSVQSSQTTPTHAFHHCLKGMAFLLNWPMSVASEKAIHVFLSSKYILQPQSFNCVEENILQITFVTLTDFYFTGVFIKMDCILPSKCQGLQQPVNKPGGTLWGLHHLCFRIFSIQGGFWWSLCLNLITDVILLKQATCRFKHARPRLVQVCRRKDNLRKYPVLWLCNWKDLVNF